MFTVDLQSVSLHDRAEVGGKGAVLGELMHAGFPVPQGFVITTKAYQTFSSGKLSRSLKDEIGIAFDGLAAQRVAVRSSAVAEDAATASWAGQLESYLNVSKEALFTYIKQCWNSVNTDKAQSYAKEHTIPRERLAVAVIIQKMIESESSGVAFTENPITANPNEMIIEACYGIGELLVQGKVTPDTFVLSKDTLEVKTISPHRQSVILAYEKGRQREVGIARKQREKPSIVNDQVRQIALLTKQIEHYLGAPQDIEWAIEKGTISILQSRPITTLA